MTKGTKGPLPATGGRRRTDRSLKPSPAALRLFRLSTFKKLVILVAAGLLGLVAFTVFTVVTANRVKVGGALYRNVSLSKDLTSEALPPPLYLIEAFLIANQLQAEHRPAERETLIRRVAEIHREFDARAGYWEALLPAGDERRKLLLEVVCPSASAVLGSIENGVIPALRRGDKAEVDRIVDGSLSRLHAVHRAAVDQLTAATLRDSVRAEAHAKVVVENLIGTLILIAALIALGLLFIGYLSVRSIAQREDALRTSEHRLNLAVQGSGAGLWDWSIPSGDVFFSPRFLELLDYTEDEFPGRVTSFFEILHPEDSDRVQRAIEDHLSPAGTPYDIEYRLRMKHGEYRWFHARGEAIFDSRGTAARMAGSIYDIHDRKLSEREIQHLKDDLANIINSMPAMLVGLDEGGRITQWNRQAESASGIAVPGAIGRLFQEILPGFAPAIEDLLKAIRLKGTPVVAEKVPVEREGERHLYDLMLYPLVQEGQNGAVLRIEDVTDRARIQELMVQAEKMMSVGGLAAGMAHEINNPLGIISQAAQNIERRLATSLPANLSVAEQIGLDLDRLKAYFEKRQIPQFIAAIQEAVARSTKIVRNMLQFSRQSESTRRGESIKELLEQSLELAMNDYDLKKKFDFRSVRLVREYPPEDLIVPVVAIEIEQVLLNLLRNAAQAMAVNPVESPPTLVLRIFREARYAVIEIEDNGPGMDEAVRARIFEPFFTTKDPGVGTGLGLSVSYTIITRNHKGLVEAVSSPGQGACFKVRLPLELENTNG